VTEKIPLQPKCVLYVLERGLIYVALAVLELTSVDWSPMNLWSFSFSLPSAVFTGVYCHAQLWEYLLDLYATWYSQYSLFVSSTSTGSSNYRSKILGEKKKLHLKQGMVVYTNNTSTWGAGTGGLGVQGQPGLYTEFEASPSYIARPCFKKPKKNQKNTCTEHM
jgi:hypothetical protein